MTDLAGQTVSHYAILELLGGGGMGIVYKARDLKLDRQVALKFLPPELTRDPDAKQRFAHEARAASALQHNNICVIHDIDETGDGQLFIVMEYYAGETLKKKIQGGPLTPQEVVRLGRQIADGLSAAHGEGMVHRDIKPANIMVTSGGGVRIVDFGLAKLAGTTRITRTGTTLGTAAYLAPEQVRGEDADHRADIWALGVVLYEMLTGRLPFRAEHDAALAYSILNQPAEPLSVARPGIPRELEAIVTRCLEKDPGVRYQSARDVRADLERVPAEARIESRPPAKPHARIGRHWPWAAAAVLALVAFALLLGRLLWPPGAVTPSGKIMLVVLPFENLGAAEDEYFADGITEEITSRLASIHALGVIARTSAMQYKRTPKDIHQIGSELGVSYVLEGTVRWAKSRDGQSIVRVTPQLIGVSDATHIWSEVYEESIAEVFKVQGDIATRVAEALKISLLEPEQRVVESAPTANAEAYDLMLRGRPFFGGGYDRATYEEAIRYLQQAVTLDPSFALAYAWLSIAHSYMYWFHWDHTEARLANAEKAAERALALQPTLAEAHSALGYYFYMGRLDYERALQEFDIALKTRPSDAEVVMAIGYVKRRQGRCEEAAEWLSRGVLLDPRSASGNWNLGETYRLLRKYPESVAALDRAIALQSGFISPLYLKVHVYIDWRGDVPLARRALDTALASVTAPVLDFTGVSLEILDRKYAAALRRLDAMGGEVLSDQWNYVPASLWRGDVLRLMHEPQRALTHYDSARALLEKEIESAPADSRLHSALGLALAGLGRRPEAIREGTIAVDMLPISREAYRGAVRVLDLARIYAMTGEHDAAIERLELLLSMPSPLSRTILKLDPVWDGLRDNPRFRRLVAGI